MQWNDYVRCTYVRRTWTIRTSYVPSNPFLATVDPVTATPDAEQRSPLNRARVLEGAIVFADERGLGDLSMRKLAASLGFEVMSLYNHVTNKGDMLDGMVDLVVGEAGLPPDGLSWRDALKADTLAQRASLQRHPWASALVSNRMPGARRIAHMEWQLATLATAGLPEEIAHHGFHALNNHLVGYTLTAQSLMAGQDANEEELIGEFMSQLDDVEHAHTIRHIHQHMDPEDTTGESFEFVLDLILDGLARATES